MKESTNNKKLVLGGVLLILVLLTYTIFGDRGLLRVMELSAEKELITAQSNLIAEENRALALNNNALKNDMETIEKTARKELDLVRKDEIIYKFVEN